jgi:hypothetical protein
VFKLERRMLLSSKLIGRSRNRKNRAQEDRSSVLSIKNGDVLLEARQSDVENVETAEASPLRHTMLINRLCPQSWKRQSATYQTGV